MIKITLKKLPSQKLSSIVTLLFFGLLFFISCKEESSTTQKTGTEATSETKFSVPKFNRDSAFVYVENQVAFGPRVPNSEAHRKCKEWLVNQFKDFGATVIEQDFQAKAYNGVTLNSTNIIAQYNPAASKRIVLAAHWDSRHIADSPLSNERQKEPILGADDGGSGVGVLLEIGRLLNENPVKMGVDLILFDSEDYGDDDDEKPNPESWCLGSQYWSRNLHAANYRPKYGILLDMVGTANARFTKEAVSMNFAPLIMNKTWELANKMGYGNLFVNDQSPAVTDDHYFVNTIAKIPMIDIINKQAGSQTGFGAHWHTHNDNMEVISKRTLQRVGKVMVEVIYREDNGSF